MPMIDTTGIRPIERRQPTDDISRVRRRDEGGGGFRPQTNVNLKTAIQEMAATLGKIGTSEKYGIQKLPQEVGDVVKNILRQALSVESTLGKGIGSTVESQRFSMDQLMLFSRLLLQVGTLAEKGYSMKISEDTQALLTNLKSALVSQEGGEVLEPVLITKSAFELVDAKTADQLPQALYEILSQLSQPLAATQQQQPQSESMQFLKQLVKFFMPRPGVDTPIEEEPQQQSQQSRQFGGTQRFLQSMFKNFGGRFSQPGQPQTQFQQQNQQGQPNAQFQQQNQQGQPNAQFQQQNQQGQPNAQFQQQSPQGQPQTQFLQQTPNGQPQAQFQQQTPNGQPQAQFQQQNQQGQPNAQLQQQNQQGQPNAQFQQQNQQGQPNAQFQQQTPNGQPQAQFQQQNQQEQPNAQFLQQTPQGQPNAQFLQQTPQGQPNAQFLQQTPQGQPQTQFQQQNPNGHPNAQFQQQNPNGHPNAQFQQQNPQGQPQAQFQQQNPNGQSQTQFQQQNPNGQPQTQFQQQTPNGQPQTQFQQQTPNGQPNAQFQQQNPQGQPNAQFQQQTPQGQPQTQFQQQNPQGQPNAQFQQQNPQGQPNAQFLQQTPQGQPQAQFQQQTPNGQPNTQLQQQSPNGQPQAQFQQQTPNGQPNAQFLQQTPQGQPQTQFQQQTPNGQPQTQFQQQTPQGQPQTQQGQPQVPYLQKTPMGQPQKVDGEFIVRQREVREQIDVAKKSMLKQNLQNTPQTTETMKNLAQFLLRDTQMTPRDTALLQNFVNNSQSTMSEDEARHLQNLLRLCQNNIPVTVRQAAIQQNLPDLPRLWAFMQMCDMAGVAAKMNPRNFKKAGKDVADFVTTMRHALSAENSVMQTRRSFQMMMPLYMGDNDSTYPTYINVYNETERDPDTGEYIKETWLRICVLTDYIGAAELVFRIHDENHVDMRFYFSRIDIAEEFRSLHVDDLRASLKQTDLDVGEIRVGGVGERMFSF